MKILIINAIIYSYALLYAQDLDLSVKNSLVSGLNTTANKKLFLDAHEEISNIKPSSYFEHIYYKENIFYENIFYITYPDGVELYQEAVKKFSQGEDFYDVKDVLSLSCAIYIVDEHNTFYVGSFVIDKYSSARLFYVMTLNRSLLYVGVSNKHNPFLSTSLPVYSSNNNLNHPFMEFDLDIKKHINENQNLLLISPDSKGKSQTDKKGAEGVEQTVPRKGKGVPHQR